jgi:hypothetical protein
VKTLIITVGTRQVGWHCRDGIVRSLGADGDRGHPPHIDQLYAELNLERKAHWDGNASSQWGVRHLGEQFYQRGQASGDFSNVELLLDAAIIAAYIQEGLDHIILWGTDQPESVAWHFRRADTLWLAKLMAKKIEQSWPQIKVDVWHPIVPANRADLIRPAVEAFILDYALERLQPNDAASLTLLIQTKGSAPQIATTLEICAAALIRQCAVVQVTPLGPNPLFKDVGDNRTAQTAIDFDAANLGQYFWPLERSRIQSAWQRGDFAEAQLWLGAHRDRHEALYQLAGCLTLAANGQISDTLQRLNQDWLHSLELMPKTTPDERQEWQNCLARLLPEPSTIESEVAQTWETLVLIERLLWRGSYTRAFLWFAQTLERLLYLQGQKEDWLQQGWVKERATLGGWIHGWQKRYDIAKSEPLRQMLHAILNVRNELVHAGRPTTADELEKLWNESRLMPKRMAAQTVEPMQLVLTRMTEQCFPIPEKMLLDRLCAWGVQQLEA